jgi:tetratricopeptide (TPR) repeat protein
MVAATGPNHPWLSVAYASLAYALFRRGELDAARDAGQRATVLHSGLGAADARQGQAFMVLSLVALEQERYADAERDARRALSLLEGQEGELEEDLPTALYALGLARLRLGDPRDARAQCDRASLTRDRTGPLRADRVYAGDFLRCLGEAELALGDVVAARQHLERSVALPLRFRGVDLPEARFELARALSTGPSPDPVRARALAALARKEMAELSAGLPWVAPKVEAVDRWLADVRE